MPAAGIHESRLRRVRACGCRHSVTIRESRIFMYEAAEPFAAQDPDASLNRLTVEASTTTDRIRAAWSRLSGVPGQVQIAGFCAA
jgi:hypothetical protein